MPRIGTAAHPICIRVNSMEKAEALVSWADDMGWNVIASVDPDQPDDLAQLRLAFIATDDYDDDDYGSPKIGRNDPCPCGSRKKFKKCCLDSFSSPIR